MSGIPLAPCEYHTLHFLFQKNYSPQTAPAISQKKYLFLASDLPKGTFIF